MFKSLIFQLFTIWIYMCFCGMLLWCKFVNIFINMEWAIKILYLGMNLICENILKIEENWTNKFICSKHCKNHENSNEDDTFDEIDNESFDDFIKKIKNQNQTQPTHPIHQHNTNSNEKQNLSYNMNHGHPVHNPNVSASNVSTLHFPSNHVNSQVPPDSQGHINHNGVDHDKIKRLIDKMYMKTIIEDNEIETSSGHYSPFSKNNNKENRQIIFSRGVKEIDNNVPEPN